MGEKKEDGTYCRVELVCAHWEPGNIASVSNSSNRGNSAHVSILTRWVTAIMNGEKRNGVSSGVLRP